jgi:hypothetical protein
MREKKLSIRLGDKLHAELAKKAEKYNQSISEYVRGVLIREVEKEEKKTIQYWQLTSGDIFAIKMVNGEFTEACGPLHHKDVTLKNLEEENFEFETEDISWLNEQYDKGNLKLKKIEEEKKMDTKSKKVIVYWVMGSDGVAGKYYDSSKHKWVFINNPPLTHWEAYKEMRKSNALVCPQCGQVFYQHIGENWDAVEYEFNNHLDFCEEE